MSFESREKDSPLLEEGIIGEVWKEFLSREVGALFTEEAEEAQAKTGNRPVARPLITHPVGHLVRTDVTLDLTT